MKHKKESISFKENLKEYLSFLKPYKWLVGVLVFTVLLMEALRLVDKIIFKYIIDEGTNFAAGTLAKTSFVSLLITLAGVYIAAVIVRTINHWFNGTFTNKLEGAVIKDLKQKYFNHLVHLSHHFHTTHKTGSLIARLGRGANAVERMTDFMMSGVLPLIFQIVIVGVSLAYVDMGSAIMIVVISVVFVVYSFILQQMQKKSNEELNESEDIEKANVGDIFTNIDSIKYFGKEYNIKKKFSNLSERTKVTLVRYWNYFRWMDAGQSMILSVGTFLLLYFPLVKFLSGGISLGSLVFIYTVYGNITGPLFNFVGGIRGYYRSMTDFHDLFGYGKIKNDIEDKENAQDMDIQEGAIDFNNMTFKYNERAIFSDFNLKINKNEKVALVGHSGSGKTTLIKLLYRLYDVNKGEITIDGKNINEFKQESLRSELSIVPQECVLFDDTIYNNILFSNPSASRYEVMRAMKLAQLDKIVLKFPQKERTLVGQRGVKLSGGEKQRVSIARAILANKKVIVLDEATSSLDSQTEHDIQQALRALLKNRTSIIIAHRLSTIMHADKIVVLEHGKIVQIGKHDELIRKKGVYRNLWELQRGGYISE